MIIDAQRMTQQRLANARNILLNYQLNVQRIAQQRRNNPKGIHKSTNII